MRDADVIAAANRLGLAMMFTGVRHSGPELPARPSSP